MGRNIVVIGFMGSGKSTVSRYISKKYGFCLRDMDEMIEEKTHKTIPDIFAESGEDGFRRIETELLTELAAAGTDTGSDTIYSTGGGVVTRPENRPLLRRIGTVFYLEISPEEVLFRLSGDTNRPLLQGDDKETRVRTLMEQREPMYREAADHCISVDHSTPARTARRIMELLDTDEGKSTVS